MIRDIILIWMTLILVWLVYEVSNLTTVIREKQIILKVEHLHYDITAGEGSSIHLPE